MSALALKWIGESDGLPCGEVTTTGGAAAILPDQGYQTEPKPMGRV